WRGHTATRPRRTAPRLAAPSAFVGGWTRAPPRGYTDHAPPSGPRAPRFRHPITQRRRPGVPPPRRPLAVQPPYEYPSLPVWRVASTRHAARALLHSNQRDGAIGEVAGETGSPRQTRHWRQGRGHQKSRGSISSAFPSDLP